MLINSVQQKQLSEQIAYWEARTAAEFVVVIARKSDAYRHTPLIIAALLALLTPLILQFGHWWLSSWHITLTQWGVFIVTATLGYIPFIHRLITPRFLKKRRAAQCAREQFFNLELHHTRDASGLLVFISEFEHYVEILADSGVQACVEADYWESVLQPLVAEIRHGKTAAGLMKTIDTLGALLAEKFPADDSPNQLPDNVIIL